MHDFRNTVVLRNVTFNFNTTFEIVVRIVRIVAGLKYSVIMSRESPTKYCLLRIEELVYTKRNLKVR